MILLPALLMARSGSDLLAVGQPLPALKGEFLTGRQATLPDAASGRVTLLALGFTYKSRFAVEAWAGRFRRDFGEAPQVSFYEIPMIGGVARLGKWFIDRGMRNGTPQADHEHVITVYGGTKPWKRRLGYQVPDAAYLILLDPQGIVRWRYSGTFDEETYKWLAQQVRELAGI